MTSASVGQRPIWQEALESRAGGERVIGCYMSPMRVFGVPAGAPPTTDWATEVIRTVKVRSLDVLITRMGGLFVLPPPDLSNPYAGDTTDGTDLLPKFKFEELATEAFNDILCELALDGMWSEPVSPVHLSFGQLVGGTHAVVVVASGASGVTHLERTLGPVSALLTPLWLQWTMHPETVLDVPLSLRRADALKELSATLPTFVTSAYSAASRRLLPEAVLTGWAACEQILDHLWKRYLDDKEAQRRDRLSDARTYSAAVRTEVLHTAGWITEALYDELNKARKHRNDLAHRTKIDLRGAQDTMTAMYSMLGLVVGARQHPSLSTGVNW